MRSEINNLAKIRKMRKMTQEELAAKSGVSRATIALIETNKLHTSKLTTLQSLAKALDSTITEIFLA